MVNTANEAAGVEKQFELRMRDETVLRVESMISGEYAKKRKYYHKHPRKEKC